MNRYIMIGYISKSVTLSVCKCGKKLEINMSSKLKCFICNAIGHLCALIGIDETFNKATQDMLLSVSNKM